MKMGLSFFNDKFQFICVTGSANPFYGINSGFRETWLGVQRDYPNLTPSQPPANPRSTLNEWI